MTQSPYFSYLRHYPRITVTRSDEGLYVDDRGQDIVQKYSTLLDWTHSRIHRCENVSDTHVHLDVGFLRVHVTVVVCRIALHVTYVIRLRHAVHQVAIQFIRVTQNLRRYDRSVATECLKRSIQLESAVLISTRRILRPFSSVNIANNYRILGRDLLRNSDCGVTERKFDNTLTPNFSECTGKRGFEKKNIYRMRRICT